ncbi:MAG: hypothetical protein AB4060_01400 [Crocosphaera sp.]
MQPSRSQGMEIQKLTGLKPRHFADLVRASQLVFDPTGGVFGRRLHVDWSVFGLSANVIDNLRQLGEKYQYSSPYVPMEIIWVQLTPETRSWFIDHKDILWEIEEAYPPIDED